MRQRTKASGGAARGRERPGYARQRTERPGGAAYVSLVVTNIEEMNMSKIREIVAAGLAVSILFGGLAACEKKEGPGERAGKQLDKAVETTGQKIEQAGEKIQDAAKDAKK